MSLAQIKVGLRVEHKFQRLKNPNTVIPSTAAKLHRKSPSLALWSKGSTFLQPRKQQIPRFAKSTFMRITRPDGGARDDSSAVSKVSSQILMNLRTIVITFLFFASLGIVGAAQQQPTAKKPATSTTQPASTQGSKTDAAFSPASANSSQELAHASNEAAGEDETEAFKYSPAVRGIAKITGLSLVTAYWFCVVINFAIIAVLVLLALKSNLPVMFRGRTETIQKEMAEARRASEEAQHRLQEIEARLARMNVEIGEMQARAESDARAEEERIRASIEEEKQKIIHTAEQEVEQAANAARRDLQKYAVALAVEMAEKGIRVDANEDKLLVEDFTEQLASEARRNGGS